jgi:hypothetical protein
MISSKLQSECAQSLTPATFLPFPARVLLVPRGIVCPSSSLTLLAGKSKHQHAQHTRLKPLHPAVKPRQRNCIDGASGMAGFKWIYRSH